jgi:hypothetical protein
MIRYLTLALALLAALLIAPNSANATADGCAVVLRTPDGFLNLRKAPMMGSKIVARLKPGELIDITEGNCQEQGSYLQQGLGQGYRRSTAGWRLSEAPDHRVGSRPVPPKR